MSDIDLSSQWWRLNNLYYIVDKSGQRVKFKANWAQKILFDQMWYLCVILKARQLGMTTFIQLFMLDCCLFNENTAAGVIAHNREDAEDFFNKKIKYAYDNLPEQIRNVVVATTDSAKQLSFSNGSSIRVGTSLRSGTLQYLHVSEFGKICAKYPDKAEEIISGSLNTVEAGSFIFLESTAEGAWGRFYEICQASMAFAGKLTKLDFKFFFFSWWQHPNYTLDDEADIPEDDAIYFTELEDRDIKLTTGQKGWYSKKKAVQRGKMSQEYPSFPDEAFEQVLEYAVYGKEIGDVVADGRISTVPVNHSKPVHLFFDLGKSMKNETTCIWFMQDTSPTYSFVDYHQDTLKTVGEYVRIIQEKGYIIGDWYIPHDGGNQHDYDIKTFETRLIDAGVRQSQIKVVKVVPELRIGIDLMKEVFPFCFFDKIRCAEGLKALRAYSYSFDEKRAIMGPPVHNWASHPADALRQFAQGYKHGQKVTPEVSKRRKEAIRRNTQSSRSWVV